MADDATNPTKGTRSDTLVAVRNAVVLGASLVATWSVALVVRMVLPRALGPERFGQYNFAESFSTTCAVALSFGIETYIQKEIPARPAHAKDFVGGALAARFGVIALVMGGQHAFGLITHRPDDVRRALLVFAIAQLAQYDAGTFAALLHATRSVGRLAILNVVSKVLWAGGTLAVVAYAGGRLELLAAAFLASEAVRALVLLTLARGKLDLPLAVDAQKTWAAIRSALPYYVNAVAITVYAKIDVTIMALQLPDAEVGWYGTAWGVAGITMLLTPLMGAVLMPQLSRAAARSRDELYAMFRRSLELLLVIAIPVSLLMGLSADLVMGRIFGAKFLPAVWALRILAPMFVLTYLAMLSAMTLVLSGRGWTATGISLASIAANAGLNTLLLRPGLARLGTGGGGTTAAAISVGTEVMVTAAMLAAIGLGNAFDRKNLGVLGKCALGCAIAIGLHVALEGIGGPRLLLALSAYAAIALATRAVRPGELVSALRDAYRRRRADV